MALDEVTRVTEPTSDRRTVSAALRDAAAAEPDRRAVAAKRRGIWQITTLADLDTRVDRLVGALQARGVSASDTGLLLLDPGVEWIVADIALQRLGARSAALAGDPAPAHLEEVIDRLDPGLVLVQNQNAADLLFDATVRRQRPVPLVLYVEPVAPWPEHEEALRPLEELLGADHVPEEVPAAKAGELVVARGDGPWPVITAEALMAAVDATVQRLRIEPGDRVVSGRHFALHGERAATVYPAILGGALLVIAESYRALDAALRETGPTVAHLDGVHLGDITASLRTRLEEAPGLKGLAGRAWLARSTTGQQITGWARRLVSRPALRRLGLASTDLLIVSGEDPDDETLLIWAALGVEVRPIHLEPAVAGPVTVPPAPPPPGCRGTTVAGMELRTAEDGRLAVRGAAVATRTVDAYHQESALPTDAEGWHLTATIAELRPDRQLEVLGTSDAAFDHAGQRVVPQALERDLRRAPLIRRAVVLPDGDGIAVVVDVVEAAAGRIASAEGHVWSTRAALVDLEPVRQAIEEQIQQVGLPGPVRAVTIPSKLEQVDGGSPDTPSEVDRHALARRVGVAAPVPD